MQNNLLYIGPVCPPMFVCLWRHIHWDIHGISAQCVGFDRFQGNEISSHDHCCPPTINAKLKEEDDDTSSKLNENATDAILL